MFVKDSDQRAKQSQEQLKRVKELIQDLHSKGTQECDLHSLREKLQKQHHEHLERGDLIEQYRKESDELDGLIRDIQKQKKDIESEIDKINAALEERFQKMNE